MGKYAGKRSIKTGMPPGSFVHIGARRAEDVSISVIEYDGDLLKHIDIDDVQDLAYYRDSEKISWINIDGLQNTMSIESIGDIFKIHPLVIEDMLNTDQRPKIEDYGDYIYIVLKQLFIDEDTNSIISDYQNIVFGKGFVISAGESRTRIFAPIRQRLESGGKIRKMGADFLAYSLLDTIVDNYFDVLEMQGDKIEEVEGIVINKPTPDMLKKINEIKKDMLFIHKNVWPLREITNFLERGDTQLVLENTRLYIRDLHDHVIQVMDTTEIYRDILSGMLDIYLSSISNRMNEIMKVLTIISTIFIPLSFLAGVYGMNFRHMPELEWRYGYITIICIMIAVAGVMLALFKRKKWI